MMNSIYGGLGKLFVMFVLASQPGIQEKGAVVAIGFGVLLTSFLHIATVRQRKTCVRASECLSCLIVVLLLFASPSISLFQYYHYHLF